MMPAYYTFLKYFKDQGYVFWDFQTYWNADKSNLPEKLLIVRHDIHYRDIQPAYTMSKIDRTLLGDHCSTFYVMLDMPPESKLTNYAEMRNSYLQVIKDLKKSGFEVEPHVSPIDMYIAAYHPWWENQTISQLRTEVDGNYRVDDTTQGDSIVTTGSDVLDLSDFDSKTIDLLQEYNQNWTNATSLKVLSYSGHGTSEPLNKVISNGIFLNQSSWLSAGVYEFDVYNSQILSVLKYLSDAYSPNWMEDPSRIEPGQYEFLAHPYEWQSR